MNDAQVQALTTSYFNVPADLTTTMLQIGMDVINGTLNEIGQQLAFITGHDWKPVVDASTGAALTAIQSVKDALAGLNDKTIDITTRTTNYINSILNGPQDSGTRSSPAGRTSGDLYGSITNVNGYFKAFANGGFNDVAQVAPAGSNILFAEPGTGGESFIPWAASKRERSTDILAQTAAGFGYGLTSGSSNDGQLAEIQGLRDDVSALGQLLASVITQSTNDQTVKLTLAQGQVRRVNAS